MKKVVLLGLTLCLYYISKGQTQPFDELNANSGSNKKIEWTSSGYGSGYGHKIYNLDPGFGGKTLLNFAGRNNSTSWTDIMTITSNGKVGIGTSDPSANLHVLGSTFLNGSVTSTGTSFVFNNNSEPNATIWLTKPTSGPGSIGHYYIKAFDWWGAYLHFQGAGDNGNEKLNVTFDGNVGIGTTSPDTKLHIEGTTSTYSRIANSSGNTRLTFGAVNGRNIIYSQNYSGGAQTLKFQVNNESNFVINSNGNIGIGTSSPSGQISILRGATNSGNKTWNSLNQATLDYYADSQDSYNRYLDISAIGQVSGGNGGSNIRFITNPGNSNSGIERMLINSNGNVGIGTSTTGSHRLAVEGSIGAREIKVEATGWSDFVFEKDYDLRTLEEVEEHIIENGHLPEIPSEAEVTENGINLGEMDAKLLQKIEELTLYMIDMNKRVKELETENQELKEEISTLKSK